MIGTMPTGSDPRAELRERLAYLLEEIPQLEAELQATESELAGVALDNDKQEMHDIVRLLACLDDNRSESRDGQDLVRLNDRVTIRAPRSRDREELVVHEPGLHIRARGFISADSPLGAAVVGRRVGESVTVRAPGGSPQFVIESVQCA